MNKRVIKRAGRSKECRPPHCPQFHRLREDEHGGAAFVRNLIDSEDAARTRNNAAVLAFRLAGHCLGMAVAAVIGIEQPPLHHSLPRCRNGMIQGVAGLHGELVLMIDLAKVLGLPPQAGGSARRPGYGARCVVSSLAGRRVAFNVESVQGLRHYQSQCLASVTSAELKDCGLIEGVITTAQPAVHVLSLQRLEACLEKVLA